MRSFPRTACRRALAASAAAALAVTLASVPDSGGRVALAAQAGDDLDDKKDRVERQIDRAASEFQHSSARAARAAAAVRVAQASLDEAQGRLDAAEGRLTAARALDQEMQEQLAQAVERLRAATRAVDAAARRLEGQQADVADVVSDFYQEGDPELLAFASFLDAQDPADLTRRVEARRVLVGAETRAYDDLRAAEVLLVVQEDEIEEYRDEVERRREEAAAHLERMKDLKAAAVDARAEVRGRLRTRYQARAKARSARQADAQDLAELRAEEQRVSALLAQRAAAARARARRAAASRGAARPSVRSGGGYLSYAGRGARELALRLPDPPDLRLLRPARRHRLRRGCGSPLYAAANGTVVSSYYQSAYGNRLILDHGAVRGVGLATIYNHATSYTVSPGQRVSRGQVVGYVGSTGWSTGCHLHFTVTVNGGAVDPMSWL